MFWGPGKLVTVELKGKGEWIHETLAEQKVPTVFFFFLINLSRNISDVE